MTVKKLIGFTSTLAVLGVLLLASPSAQAICANPVSFAQGTGGYGCGATGAAYCYIYSGGTADVTAIQGDFWSLTFGDPVVGAGSDDGNWVNGGVKTYQGPGWLTQYYAPPAAYGWNMQTNNQWAKDTAIDGCIEGQLPPGHTSEVMVAMWSDQASDGSTAFWGAIAVERVGAASPQFDFSTPGEQFTLVEVPNVSIVGSRIIDAANIEVDIQCPDLSPGFRSPDGTTALSEVVQGCAIFRQQLGEGAVGPGGAGSRDTDAGWTDLATVIPNGAVGSVTLSGCDVNSSNYLGIAVAFDSGFKTEFVGPNSNRVDCGPDIANPNPRFKIIDRDPKGKGRLGPKER